MHGHARLTLDRPALRENRRADAVQPGGVPGELWWLLALLAAAFLFRVFESWGTFLDPDEAIHATIAGASNLASVYRLSTEQAHPPLYFFLLHFWAGVVRTDFGLRLPSILMATAAVAFLFAAFRRRVGFLPAFATASLLALSPFVVDLTSQVRGYSLLLLLLSAALFVTASSTGLPSARQLAATGGLLITAEATHYSGILFAASLTAALLVDLWHRQAPRRTWAAFWASTASVALFTALLWSRHVSVLRGGAVEADAMAGWLRPFYWQPGEGLVGFLTGAFVGVYSFLLGPTVAAGGAALVALIALAVRARRDPGTTALLALPFVVAFFAAAMRIYPLGPTRHSLWLFPAASAALWLPLARMKPAASRWILRLLAILLPVWAFSMHGYLMSGIPRADRKDEHLQGLLSMLSRRVGPSDVVFVDKQTATLLRRYLPGPPLTAGPAHSAFGRETPGGMNVWVSQTWLLDAPTFVSELTLLRMEAGLAPGQRVWVVNAGSRSSLLPDLVSAYPGAPVTFPAGFGNSIWMFRIALP